MLPPCELLKCEALLKESRKKSSAAVGHVIKLGSQLLSEEVTKHMQDVILPFVCEKLDSVHFCVQKCYSLLLTASKLV